MISIFLILFSVLSLWVIITNFLTKDKESSSINKITNELLINIVLSSKSLIEFFDSIFKSFFQIYELLGSTLKSIIEIFKVFGSTLFGLLKFLKLIFSSLISLSKLIFALINETRSINIKDKIIEIKEQISQKKDDFYAFLKSKEISPN